MPNADEIIARVNDGRYEEALGVSFDAKPREIDDASIRLSRRYCQDAKVRQAINKASTQLKTERTNPHRHGERCRAVGIKLSESGKKGDSLPYLQKAVDLLGEGFDYHWLGSTLAQTGRLREAIAHLEKAVQLRGDLIDHKWLNDVKEATKPQEHSRPVLPTDRVFRPSLSWDPDQFGRILREVVKDPQLAEIVIERMRQNPEEAEKIMKALPLGNRASPYVIHHRVDTWIRTPKPIWPRVLCTLNNLISGLPSNYDATWIKVLKGIFAFALQFWWLILLVLLGLFSGW